MAPAILQHIVPDVQGRAALLDLACAVRVLAVTVARRVRVGLLAVPIGIEAQMPSGGTTSGMCIGRDRDLTVALHGARWTMQYLS